MRKTITIIAIMISIAFCFSCNKSNVNIKDKNLYTEMLSYSQHYASLFETMDLTQTKSSNYSAIDFDINLLSDKLIHYINLYTEPENMEEWNEVAVLNLISSDSTLSNKEVEALTHGIAFAYYLKNNYNSIETKTTADDCWNAYKKARNRAIAKAAALMALSTLEPTIAAEVAVAVNYAFELDAIGADFEACLASV